MTTLEEQTAVERTAEGKYQGVVSEAWKLWVPVGGYLTAIALRAAQASSVMPRPVSVTCHYLNEATFGPVDLDVSTLRSTERAESLLVRMVQGGKDILVALVSAAPTGAFGPNVNWLESPDAPPPEEVAKIDLDQDVVELMGDEPFWKNLEVRMIRLGGGHEYPSIEGLSEDELRLTPRRDARVRSWQRMPSGEAAKDPWVDACRSLIISAAIQFPTVADPFTPPLRFIAPTMNLTVDFHTFHPEEQWLLTEGSGSYAGDGLLGAQSRIWTQAGEVVATGHAQMTYHDFSDSRTMGRLQKTWFELTEA